MTNSRAIISSKYDLNRSQIDYTDFVLCGNAYHQCEFHFKRQCDCVCTIHTNVQHTLAERSIKTNSRNISILSAVSDTLQTLEYCFEIHLIVQIQLLIQLNLPCKINFLEKLQIHEQKFHTKSNTQYSFLFCTVAHIVSIIQQK